MTDPITLRGFICDHMLSLALHLDFQFDSLTHFVQRASRRPAHQGELL